MWHCTNRGYERTLVSPAPPRKRMCRRPAWACGVDLLLWSGLGHSPSVAPVVPCIALVRLQPSRLRGQPQTGCVHFSGGLVPEADDGFGQICDVSESRKVRVGSLGAHGVVNQCLDDEDDGSGRGFAVAALSGCLAVEGWLDVVAWECDQCSQSGGGTQPDDLVPGGESGAHLVSVLGCGESVPAGAEVR